MTDWVAIREGLQGVGTLLGGAGTAYAHMRITHRKIAAELEECKRDRTELRRRISALETEQVVMKKLMPPGEWWKKLGLEDPPAAS